MKGDKQSDELIEKKMDGKPPLQEGEMVFDIFSLVKRRDVFGLRDCWEAKRGFEGHKVLLCFVPDKIREDEADLDAFEGQVLAGAKFEHQFLLGMRKFWRNEDLAAVELQWVEGEKLDGVQTKLGGLSKKVSLKWLNQLGSALSYLHEECGIVHRDFRAELVVIDEKNDQAILVPPGLRRRMMGDEGDQLWMSPQQQAGEAAQIGDDVYAIGFMARQMTKGWKKSEALDESLTKALSADVERRPKSVGSFVKNFSELVEKSLEKGKVAAGKSDLGKDEIKKLTLDDEDLVVKKLAKDQVPVRKEKRVARRKSVTPKPEERKRSKWWILPAIGALVIGCGLWAWKGRSKDPIAKETLSLPSYAKVAEEKAKESETKIPPVVTPPLEAEVPEEVLLLEWSDGKEAGELGVLDEGNLGLRMRWIPEGEADLGGDFGSLSTTNEKGKKVSFERGFWMGESEVSELLWNRVMLTREEGGLFPKVGVSWKELNDETGLIAKLNEKAPEGWELRLPTRNEWEYACLGNLSKELRGLANFESTGSREKGNGGKWGAVDLLGNVWEWCADEVVVDGVGGGLRSFMGGSWVSKVGGGGPASWRWNLPEHRSEDLGLRLVMVRASKE